MNMQTIAVIILLAAHFISLGIHLGRNGEQRNEKYNFGSTFLSFCIIMILYYFAGMFDNFLN